MMKVTVPPSEEHTHYDGKQGALANTRQGHKLWKPTT